MSQPQSRDTRASYPSLFLGDDLDLDVTTDDDSRHPVNLALSVVGTFPTVASLHLSPIAARRLRDALTRVLIGLESATIVAAGTDPELVDAIGFGSGAGDVYGAHISDRDALAIVQSFSGNTFPAMNK